MIPFTILRTAVGSAPSLFTLRLLKSIPDVRVVAADADPLSFGFHFADANYVIPLADSADFIPEITRISRIEQVSLIMAAVNEEIAQLAMAKGRFREMGVIVPVPDPQSVEICLDKYLTYCFFRQQGITTPRTFLPDDL